MYKHGHVHTRACARTSVLHGPLRDLLAAPNMTFAALREQPARLRAEAARLDECVRNVCVADDGRALLGVEECERRVGDFLERVGESVDVMVGESVDEVVGASRDQVVGDSANALLDNVTASLLTFRKLVSGDDGTTTRRDLEGKSSS